MKQRISFQEGVELFANAPLEVLRQRAMDRRYDKNPSNAVTYVLDTNPNYTNVCNVCCSFCAFWRSPTAPDAYTNTVEETLQYLARARARGLTTVLLQGGLNAKLNLDYYVTLVARARKEYPDIHPHFFTASEVDHAARMSRVSTKEALQALYDAGQRSLPGGGAEILSERVHAMVSPKKISPQTWIDIHNMAHDIGFCSTATMMYGHVETPEDVVLHLDRIRQAQDEHPGFTAFVPWSYKKDNTALSRKVQKSAGRQEYLRILAFSRLYLDNFPHVQATWFSEGKAIGVESLSYGADDFGGTVADENVHRAANHVNKTDAEGIVAMIHEAGFHPVQRTPLYELIAPACSH